MTSVLKRAALLLPVVAPLFLSACVSQSQFDTAMADNRRLQSENAQLRTDNQTLHQQVDAQRQHISRLQEAVKYTVNSDLLFPSGSWEISDAGKDVIAKMAKVLAPEQENKIVVTGYTDNVPVSASMRKQGITSNEMLSQKRADSVMQYMISQGVNPDMISARGFGETYPVVPNTSAQNRAQNRRVEVTLAAPGT